ncbi:Alpha/Beta hydrolase protein [Armillaria mellea]|nr:Alpha/Beta hydrolase protein [Armillaria mellea]
MLIGISVLCYALLAASAPEVQLGKTKLIGRDVTGLQQEFFGGEILDFPVYRVTYGGAFLEGASSSYNGSNIVAQSVTRVGIWEAYDRGQLNLGVRDVLTALEWVQQNIGIFGGDKTKVTIFGESAGAMLTNMVLLNASISNFARAAISESGSASSPVIYNASVRESNWEYFVAGTPGCESVAGTQDTFDCLQVANTSAIYQGFVEAYELAIEAIAFYPVLDGPSDAILPDLPTNLWAKGQFATIPFISGTNLDEGTLGLSTTTNFTDENIKDFIQTTYSAFPPYLSDSILDQFLELYPDDPSLGSPYDTGNETFGLPVGWKRVASMSEYRPGFSMNEPASSILLSEMMMDYWVSFATSLDPNDGLGTSRPFWPQYTPENEVLLQLNGDNTTVIPDDYRKEGIEFLRDNADAFHRFVINDCCFRAYWGHEGLRPSQSVGFKRDSASENDVLAEEVMLHYGHNNLLFSAILDFIMPLAKSANSDTCIFTKEAPKGTTGAMILLNVLMNRIDFLLIGETLKVQDQCAYNIVISVDLRQVPRHVTLEDFLVFVQTTSMTPMNAPRNLTPTPSGGEEIKANILDLGKTSL